MQQFEPSGAPFLTHSHTSWPFVVATISIGLAGLASFAKVCRGCAAFKRPLVDDYTIIISLVFGVGHAVCTCLAVIHGPGQPSAHSAVEQRSAFSKYYFWTNALLNVSLAFAKTSAAQCSLRIFEHIQWMKRTFQVLLVVVFIWCPLAEFLIIFQCQPSYYALGPGATRTCINQFAMQVSIKVLDMVTDAAIAIVPGSQVMTLQMPLLQRVDVGLTFGSRILTIPFTALSLIGLEAFYEADEASRPAKAATPSMWTSAALALSITTACLPQLRKLLSDGAAGVIHPSPRELSDLRNLSVRKPKRENDQTPASFVKNLGAGRILKTLRTVQENLVDERVEGGESSLHNGGHLGETESERGLIPGTTWVTFDYRHELNPENSGSCEVEHNGGCTCCCTRAIASTQASSTKARSEGDVSHRSLGDSRATVAATIV